MLWLTVSKAALRSSNRRIVTYCLFIFYRISFAVTFRGAVSVLWFFLWADCATGCKLLLTGCKLLLTRWPWIWLKASLSMSLDTKDKLLMGRNILNMTSRPGFFNNGKTRASFQMSGKGPDCNELSMIFVRTGTRSSHLLTNVDGIGSREQDLRAAFWISCLTSRTDSIINVGNDGTISSRTADGASSSEIESFCWAAAGASSSESESFCWAADGVSSSESESVCWAADWVSSSGSESVCWATDWVSFSGFESVCCSVSCCVRIASIFWTKYFPKSLENVLLSRLGGRRGL